MPDGAHEVSGIELVVTVMIFALPWMLGGAVIGSLVWHTVVRRGWWIGALAGAGLGVTTGFFAMMP